MCLVTIPTRVSITPNCTSSRCNKIKAVQVHLVSTETELFPLKLYSSVIVFLLGGRELAGEKTQKV
jgi:hypothetical protein